MQQQHRREDFNLLATGFCVVVLAVKKCHAILGTLDGRKRVRVTLYNNTKQDEEMSSLSTRQALMLSQATQLKSLFKHCLEPISLTSTR